MMENISFNKLNIIKRMHAILNGLKLLQCFVCHRQTPGFDSPFHNLTVLETGEKVSFVTKDIEKQLRKLNTIGNTIIRKFNVCTEVVKYQLVKAYCSTVYCGSLWSSYNVASHRKLKVCHNNILRRLLARSKV